MFLQWEASHSPCRETGPSELLPRKPPPTPQHHIPEPWTLWEHQASLLCAHLGPRLAARPRAPAPVLCALGSWEASGEGSALRRHCRGTCPFQPPHPASVRSPRQRQPLCELPRLSPLCEHSPISQAAFTQCRETYPDVASLTCLRAPPEQWLPS